MFDQLFLIKLIISFIVSGLFAVTALWFSEKLGTKWGSIIVSIPSTMAFSLLFIAWTQGTEVAAEASIFGSAALTGAFIFVMLFVSLVGRFKLLSLLPSIFLWFITALIISSIEFNIYLSSLMSFIFVIISFFYLSKIKSQKTKIRSNSNRVILRFFLVGFLVSFAVIIAKVIGPEWGGIFGSFPAMYIATFYIAYNDYGKKFAKSIAANTFYAFFGFLVYPIAVHFLYPEYGIILGTIGAYLFYLVALYLSNLILNKIVKK